MDEHELLGAILGIIVIMFFASCLSELAEQGNNVFHDCEIILPPIVTLILGYIFGKNKT